MGGSESTVGRVADGAAAALEDDGGGRAVGIGALHGDETLRYLW